MCYHREANFVDDYDSMRRMRRKLMTFHRVDDVFSLVLSLLSSLLKTMLLPLNLLLSFDDFESVELEEDVMKYWASNFSGAHRHW